MKCSECGGKVEKKKIDFSIYGISLGKFDAEVCQKCGEEVFDEKVSEQIDKKAKDLDLWSLGKKTKVIKAGNSLAIRIPKKLADFLKLKPGQEVFSHPDKNKLIIESET